MQSLLFSGEVPGQGGYMVSWREKAPPVAQCRPCVQYLCLYDWFHNRTHVRRPAVDRLSWRVIDGDGHCVARHDHSGQRERERAWLASLDLQLQSGELYAQDQSLLVLLAGLVRLHLEPDLQDLLARTGHFLDYRLGFRGPDDQPLTEQESAGQGHYAFLEKHEGFLVPL